MRTVQMTMEDELIKTVDKIAKSLNTTRSAFTREALREAVHRHCIKELEEQHRQGYLRKPVTDDEFNINDADRVWGD